MPVTDLFAASRRILGRLLGRSRGVALAAALVPLGAVGTSAVHAAPSVSLPPEFPVTPFSIRITDIERAPGDVQGNAFRVEFEALNWTNRPANALVMSVNVGTNELDGERPTIVGASMDPDGRGGPPGGNDIGPGVHDSIALHSGLGRGDLPFGCCSSEWMTKTSSSSNVQFDNFNELFSFGSPLYNRSLLSGDSTQIARAVPGFGVDALGDTAIDGGPGPYNPTSPGGGPPDPNTSGNVHDGFVLDVDDWDVGEVFSVNWFLAAIFSGSGSMPSTFEPLGTASDGNPFGFGVMSLVRIEPTIGSPAGNLPGAVFEGNVGFDQSNFSFYDTVYEIPNPAEFAAEFGQGITAPFLNPADNIFDAPVNTQLIVPEPGSLALVSTCVAGLAGASGRRRRGPTRD